MINTNYQESISLEVGKFLHSSGYEFASDASMKFHRIYSFDVYSVNCDVKPRKYLFGLITLKPRLRFFLGTIWIRNDMRNWIFEIYNNKHASLTKQLTEKMALNFNIKITIRLMRGPLSFKAYTLVGVYGV